MVLDDPAVEAAKMALFESLNVRTQADAERMQQEWRELEAEIQKRAYQAGYDHATPDRPSPDWTWVKEQMRKDETLQQIADQSYNAGWKQRRMDAQAAAQRQAFEADFRRRVDAWAYRETRHPELVQQRAADPEYQRISQEVAAAPDLKAIADSAYAEGAKRAEQEQRSGADTVPSGYTIHRP
jgi:predicted outer membrane protein